MMDQTIVGPGPASIDRLFERIEHEAGSILSTWAELLTFQPRMRRVKASITNVTVEPAPSADVGEVHHPSSVSWRMFRLQCSARQQETAR